MEDLKRPVFLKPSPGDFFLRMHREVQQTILTDRSLQRRNVLKCWFLLLSFFFFYGCILAFGNGTALLFLFYILTGFAMITLFINAYHDAVHGALFEKPQHNRWFCHILELFGSNTWLWTKRHMALHHPFPNVQHWDIDVKQSDLVRIFPGTPLLNIHRYQHIYMWFLYPMYSLNWLFIRDFKDFFGTQNNYLKRVAKIPTIEYAKLIAAKLLNIGYMIILPILVLDQPWYYIVAAWLCMHICGSMLGVIALISTHADEHAEFPEPPVDGHMGMTWAEHQIHVTKDFSPDSPIANFLFGGFTHHVAHHLFPAVPHTYYPKITPVIRRYAEENGLPYVSYPFHQAVLSHFRMLKNNGHRENLFTTGEL